MSSDEAPVMKVKKSKRSREVIPEISITPTTESETIDTPITESTSTNVDKLALTTEATEGDDAEPEVPALSHKEKRLAKRRKLSGIDDPVIVPVLQKSINTIPGVPGTIIGNTPSKSAFGIWVGNMAFGTTQKMLLGWFESKGLKEVTRLNMPGGKRPGEANRG